MEIIKIFDEHSEKILSSVAEEIPLTIEGLKEAALIVQQLTETLLPLMPAAGLAAPQIAVSKRVFIYSWDRSIANLEAVINPRILETSDGTTTSWEACFSTMQDDGTSQAGLVARDNSILVEYQNVEGKIIKKQLQGFAAKVFQHEYDHLDGIENISKKDVEIKTFENKVDLIKFMQNIRKSDSVNYLEPLELE